MEGAFLKQIFSRTNPGEFFGGVISEIDRRWHLGLSSTRVFEFPILWLNLVELGKTTMRLRPFWDILGSFDFVKCLILLLIWKWSKIHEALCSQRIRSGDVIQAFFRVGFGSFSVLSSYALSHRFSIFWRWVSCSKTHIVVLEFVSWLESLAFFSSNSRVGSSLSDSVILQNF